MAAVDAGWGSFYFVSDRQNGQQNLHLFTIGKGERQGTSFTSGRVLYPNPSYDGKALVFERDVGIWRLDSATGKTERVNIAMRGAPAGPAPSEPISITTGFGELAVSPDGKKIAFTARG